MAVTRSSRIWAGDSVANGNIVIDDTNSEALLVRLDEDGGDVVTFDSTVPDGSSNVYTVYVEPGGGSYAGSTSQSIGVFSINRVNTGTHSSLLRGGQFQAAVLGDASTSGGGDLIPAGLQLAAVHDSTGTSTGIRGVNCAATVLAGGSVVAAGLVDYAVGMNCRFNFGSPTGTGSVTNAYALNIPTPTNTHATRTVGTMYGINVGDMVATGITTAYAIKTGTGLVDFGDDVNVASGSGYQVNGTQIVGAQAAAEADVAGGAGDSDGVARTKINNILAKLRTHGLIAT